MSDPIEFTDRELRLLWLATETLVDANPNDSDVQSLDAKITLAVKQRRIEFE